MNNAVYRKTMKDVENRKNVVLVPLLKEIGFDVWLLIQPLYHVKYLVRTLQLYTVLKLKPY